jgi:small subunit ribosomal protein S4e
MARGPKKHLKRLAAPSHWMLDKLTGRYAPRPSAGPHKLRECLPLVIFLRNRLKYALTYHEVKMILKERQVYVDGKVRTDMTYPTGLMDVISIPKTGENFRMLYDTKGRYTVHKIKEEEAGWKLCKVKQAAVGKNAVPYIVTHDGRTIRYPDPHVKVNDTVKVDLDTGRMTEFIKFDVGCLVLCTGGRNLGRVGTLVHRDRVEGRADVVHVKDAAGHQFATLLSNVFVIGSGKKAAISLPKGKGVRLTVSEERDRRLAEKAKASA